MGRFFPNLFLHEYQEKAFYHALRTKGFVILAGLSGTGKTKIFEEFCLYSYEKIKELYEEIKRAQEYFKLNNLSEMNINDWHDGKGGGLLNLVANPNVSSVYNKERVGNKEKKEECGHYVQGFENLYELYSHLCRRIIPSTQIRLSELFLELSKHCGLVKSYPAIQEGPKGYFLSVPLETLDEVEGVFNVIIKEKLKEIKTKAGDPNCDLHKYVKEHPEEIIIEKQDYISSNFKNVFSRKFLELILFLYNPKLLIFFFYQQLKELELDKKFTHKKLFFPIRPDFKDSKSLLGYYNPLNREYQSTELLKFILEAQKEYLKNGIFSCPYLVLFDEMNLARVEYYFADFLSVLESKRVISIDDVDEDMKENILKFHGFLNPNEDDLKKLIGFYSKPIILHNEPNITDIIPQKLYLPPNLYFIGTVNIDETTYMLSPKVLDRAFTIEFDADIESYVENIKNTKNSGNKGQNSDRDKPGFYLLDFTREGKFSQVMYKSI
ncbi:MAG: hypothetical protein N2327_04565 [Caldimicrobium sp.]|nr:hypothetical protein [Caldimicrobium sp.]MCX7873686.1 hypothetical protein [Caldimicrobium sp.]MDW8093611.1 hypothetical protein [Caldimicrobium sp.]